MRTFHTLLLSSGVLFAAIFAGPARAETVDCAPINALPYTISTSGIYCLTGDLNTAMTSGSAITIDANNVTLDLNSWRLGGLAAGAGTTALGISADQRKNITIKNGTIRGFYRAIMLTGTGQGHVVEGLRIEQNRLNGINITGAGTIIRFNQVVDTGGSTVAGTPYGIVTFGDGARVLDNDVVGATASGSNYAYGIAILSGSGAIVANNRIDNISSVLGSYGIRVDVINALIRANSITNTSYGVVFNGSGKYMNNLTANVTTPFAGGTAVGTNN